LASDGTAISAPLWAVFVSYDPSADMASILDIASTLTQCGATVFLDEACIRADPASHVLDALIFADEVMILVTPTRRDPLNPRSPLTFLDRRFVWLAVGVAVARSIPIRALLKGMTQREVNEDSAIPQFVKNLPLFQTVSEYEQDLLRRIRNQRPPSGCSPRSHCRVCLFGRGRKRSNLVDRRLRKAGIVTNRWNPGCHVDQFDAVILLDRGDPIDSKARLFLESFVDRKKPMVLLGSPGVADAPNWLINASHVDFSEADDLSFLRLIWACVGYKPYDSLLNHEPYKFDVFMCHSSIDFPKVQELMDKFRAAAVLCWVDKEEIGMADNIMEKIGDGLQQSQYVVVCLSRHFQKSKWCRREYIAALRSEHASDAGRVVVVKLDDYSKSDIPVFLRDKRQIDISKPSELSELIRFLKGQGHKAHSAGE